MDGSLYFRIFKQLPVELEISRKLDSSYRSDVAASSRS
jgi:hypothetical protein